MGFELGTSSGGIYDYAITGWLWPQKIRDLDSDRTGDLFMGNKCPFLTAPQSLAMAIENSTIAG